MDLVTSFICSGRIETRNFISFGTIFDMVSIGRGYLQTGYRVDL